MNQQSSVYILTLDGPGGAGKGTIGQMLASHYSWHYLDSGALYRAFAFAADRSGVSHDDAGSLRILADDFSISFSATKDGGAAVSLNGEDITEFVRAEEAGKLASKYASEPVVRELLYDLQRGSARAPGLVADGRDMGSVVFKEADLKIFLTASAESRAMRRYKQLKLKGFDVNLSRLVEDIEQRDHQDANRKHSPMIAAPDAVTIDTTSLNIDQVFARITALIDK